jgi:phosphate acyltransferase
MPQFRLAIDAMSGDNGLKTIINGIVEAKQLCGDSFMVYLCGDAARIQAGLKDCGALSWYASGEIKIEHCIDSIASGDIPSLVWKTRANAPIIRCISLQKEGVADASISAGDTGVLLGASIFILGRLKGTARPALAAFLPTTKKRHILLLDVGANLNCRVDHLVSFGMMGYSYVQKYFSLALPRVGLLSIGKEPTKGTKVLFETARELKRLCRGFVGFVEGSDVLLGEADVVVCDGFAGNVLLKACESFHLLALSVLGRNGEVAEKIRNDIAVLDPENYGAVPFLGIKGIVLKAHGSSTSTAIANAIMTAITAIKKNALALTNAPAAKGKP